MGELIQEESEADISLGHNLSNLVNLITNIDEDVINETNDTESDDSYIRGTTSTPISPTQCDNPLFICDTPIKKFFSFSKPQTENIATYTPQSVEQVEHKILNRTVLPQHEMEFYMQAFETSSQDDDPKSINYSPTTLQKRLDILEEQTLSSINLIKHNFLIF